MGFVRVAALAEVPEGEVRGVEVGVTKLCLVNVEGEVYAFQDKCTHRDFPLSQGELDPDDCSITCDWHGAKFDVRSGKALTPPAVRPVPVYEVKLEGDEIWVDLPG